MNEKLYDSFLEATRNVFMLMLDLSEINENPAGSFVCDQETDISIGVIGDLTGEILFRFPHATSLNMVNIMSGMEIESVDDFVTAAISEIANIISGNVLTILAGSDLICDILPPKQSTKFNGKEYRLRTSCCISTTAGDVCLDIGLNLNK